MFEKINLKLSDANILKLQGELISEYNGKFLEYGIGDINYLTTLLENKIYFDIKPDNINITKIIGSGAPPHTDVWSTALNYYLIVSGDDTTIFFNKINENKNLIVGGLYSYSLNDLYQSGTFNAKTDDCYLLNTHQPHCVESTVETNFRIILRFIWYQKSFKEISNSIKLEE